MKTTLQRSALIPAFVLVTAMPALAQDGVAAAKSNIDAYSAIPEFVAPGEPFDALACMADKSILTIPASSAIPFIKVTAQHVVLRNIVD